MKKILLLSLLLLPMLANAMKIETDEVDEFTGKRTLITSWEHCGKNRYIHIRFRLQNDIQWLDFKLIYDDAIVIGEGDALMMKSTSDNIASFKSISNFHGGKGDGAVGFNASGAWGISATYLGDLSFFNDNTVRLIRVNFNNHLYHDYDVSEKDGKKLIELYRMFNIAINGEKVAPKYQIIYQNKPKNATKWDVVSSEYRETLTNDEVTAIRNEWEAKSDENFDYRVHIKRNKEAK